MKTRWKALSLATITLVGTAGALMLTAPCDVGASLLPHCCDDDQFEKTGWTMSSSCSLATQDLLQQLLPEALAHCEQLHGGSASLCNEVFSWVCYPQNGQFVADGELQYSCLPEPCPSRLP